MTDVAADETENSLQARCERWLAAGVNATADASSCPCDPNPGAAGQPSECGLVVVTEGADAPAWWSSFFVTVLGIGFFSLVGFLFLKYMRRNQSLRSELILRRLIELLDVKNGKPTYIGVVLPDGEAAAAKRLPDAEQTPRPDGSPPMLPGEDEPSVGLLLGLNNASGVDENRRRQLFQFAPATLHMEQLLVQRMWEEQEGRTETVDRLRASQVREQERIWREIQERRRVEEAAQTTGRPQRASWSGTETPREARDGRNMNERDEHVVVDVGPPGDT